MDIDTPLSSDPESNAETPTSRRRLLKSLVAGSTVITGSQVIPDKWITPLTQSVLLPAHAQASNLIILAGAASGTVGPGPHHPTKGLPEQVMDFIIEPAQGALTEAQCTALLGVCVTFTIIGGPFGQIIASLSGGLGVGNQTLDGPDGRTFSNLSAGDYLLSGLFGPAFAFGNGTFDGCAVLWNTAVGCGVTPTPSPSPSPTPTPSPDSHQDYNDPAGTLDDSPANNDGGDVDPSPPDPSPTPPSPDPTNVDDGSFGEDSAASLNNDGGDVDPTPDPTPVPTPTT